MAHKRPETRVWLAMQELYRAAAFEAAWWMYRPRESIYSELSVIDVRRRRRFLREYQSRLMKLNKWNQKVQGA